MTLTCSIALAAPLCAEEEVTRPTSVPAAAPGEPALETFFIQSLSATAGEGMAAPLNLSKAAGRSADEPRRRASAPADLPYGSGYEARRRWPMGRGQGGRRGGRGG